MIQPAAPSWHIWPRCWRNNWVESEIGFGAILANVERKIVERNGSIDVSFRTDVDEESDEILEIWKFLWISISLPSSSSSSSASSDWSTPPPPPPPLQPHHWPFDGHSFAITSANTTTTTTTATTTTTITTLPASADHLIRNCMNAIDLRTKPVTLRQYSIAMLSSTNNLLVATNWICLLYQRLLEEERHLRGSSLLCPSARPLVQMARHWPPPPADAIEPLHLLPTRFVENWPSVLYAVDRACRKCRNGIGNSYGYHDVAVMYQRSLENSSSKTSYL